MHYTLKKYFAKLLLRKILLPRLLQSALSQSQNVQLILNSVSECANEEQLYLLVGWEKYPNT